MYLQISRYCLMYGSGVGIVNIFQVTFTYAIMNYDANILSSKLLQISRGSYIFIYNI